MPHNSSATMHMEGEGENEKLPTTTLFQSQNVIIVNRHMYIHMMNECECT